MRFNNAAQRIFGGIVKPVVEVWATNNPAEPWCAEARRGFHQMWSTLLPS